jgi:hypothetical protein
MAVWHFVYNNVREVRPGDFRAFTPDDYLGSGLGGTESSLVLLTEGLARRGHAVHVYTHCRRSVFSRV